MMKNKMKLGLSILFISVATSSYANMTTSGCQATLVNNSNQDWQIKFNVGRGNVGLPSQYCDSNSCTMPPHSFVNMEYNFNAGFAIGSIHMFDHKGDKRLFVYASRNLNACPAIARVGESDAVYLNSPSKGSLEIMKDSW